MIKTISHAFYVFSHYFYRDIDQSIAKTFGHRTSSVFIYDEKGVLLQNIVGAEYILCTRWLNIVDAAAPTAPMVPIPMPGSVFFLLPG